MTSSAPWTSIPEAAALLASCAANPPRERCFTYDFGDTDIRYSDARVTKLRRIWEAERDRLLDTPGFAQHCRYDVQQAIADMVKQSEHHRERGKIAEAA